jgi:phosphohistidine phosphatase
VDGSARSRTPALAASPPAGGPVIARHAYHRLSAGDRSSIVPIAGEMMSAARAQVVREAEPGARQPEERSGGSLPRELVVLRHAKSAWETDAATDFERPLAARGTLDAPRVGRWLEVCGLAPDYVVSSPAERARQTADAALGAMDHPPEAILDDRVYEGSLSDLLDVLGECPSGARRVMLVGHNPGLESLVEHLAGQPIPLPSKGKPFPTAAVAHLRLPADWRGLERGAGELIAIVRPRDLPASTPARTVPAGRKAPRP